MNCLLNIVAFIQFPLCTLQVFLSHLLTSYKIGFAYPFLVGEYLKHWVALPGCHKELREAGSVTGTQKFRVNYTADYKPKLILFFNLSPHPLPPYPFMAIFLGVETLTPPSRKGTMEMKQCAISGN